MNDAAGPEAQRDPDYAHLESILVQRRGRLLTVTLDRPESLNALTPQAHADLERLWFDVATDTSVGAILLTGRGRAFCAGADMKAVSNPTSDGTGSAEVARSFVHAKRILASMLEVEQPIVGAINGPAVGLGATLAFACDVLVASETARFADTHVNNMGVVAGDGGAVLWPMMMGIHQAKLHLLTGAFLGAEEAHRLGIVSEVVPAEQLAERALEVATGFANGPSWALRWTKTTVNKLIRDRLNLVMDTGLAAEWVTFATEDHQEAVSAFRDKRPPRFHGR